MNKPSTRAGPVEPYILLVEDNQDDVILALRTLQKNRFPLDVEYLRDGVEALEFIDAARVLPVVVLLDLRLPRMNGDEVLAVLRGDARTKDIPVLLLSGSGADQVRSKESTSGANGWLEKPLNWQELEGELLRLNLLSRFDSRKDSRQYGNRLR